MGKRAPAGHDGDPVPRLDHGKHTKERHEIPCTTILQFLLRNDVGHDLGRMEAVWAHEPYVRTIHPGNRHADAGWEAVRAGWQKLFERFAAIEAGMPEPHLRVGDDVAWVTGEELFRARRSSGEAVE